jgi:phage terminase large subunit
MFQETTAQRKIARLRKRVRIVQGGTSSSKTYSIIPMLITYANTYPKQVISVVSESIPHLRRGAIRDFLNIMIDCGIYSDAQFNKSNLIYEFPNNSIIEFFSADQTDRLRGARRDVLFINECNNINFEAYHQLAIRTRKFIYLDYNPTSEFWVHNELLNDKDSDFVILTYKDNEALEPSLVREIEKARERANDNGYWSNWWKVYGLGEIGTLQGVVFDNWKQVSEIPTDAKFIAYGKDFGYTNDPTTLIGVWQQGGELWLKEFLYETGLTNPMICERLRSFGIKKEEIIADSAEPKSIQEIRMQGFNIHPATKGKDSIASGIDVLQRYKMNVTADSLNLIKELRNYKWKQDKDGKTTNEPIDYYNHLIDPLRYVALNKLQLVKRGVYGIT